MNYLKYDNVFRTCTNCRIYFSRFSSPTLYSTKVVAHDPSVSAFQVPASRSAFNRVTGVQNHTTTRRNVVLKEEQSGARMVWQPSSNEQVYRMAHITSQQPSNGSSSIIQIPHNIQNHQNIYIDQSGGIAAGQFYPYQNSTQNNNSVPIVINPRDLNNSTTYLTSVLNPSQRPAILRPRKLTKPSEEHNGQSTSYTHGDPSVYSLKERAAKQVKVKQQNNDPYMFADSPRKKPRKQAIVAHEDVFASNVPQPSHPEHSGAPAGFLVHPCVIKQEEDMGDEYAYTYLPQRKRMSLIPPAYKSVSRPAANHFERYTDIKVRKKRNLNEPIPEPSELAAQGWQLLHLKSQLDAVSLSQKETKSKICEYSNFFGKLSHDMEDRGSGAKAGNTETVSDLLQIISHCCNSNVTSIKQAMNSVDKLVHIHRPRVVELAKEYKENKKKLQKTPPPAPYSTPPAQQKKAEPAAPSSGTKRTRKRKT